MIEKAYEAVKNRLDLKLVVLHYGHGWPISSIDPRKKTLARRFKLPARQIRYRIETALKAMRAALQADVLEGVANE
jgi:hypothetical protein